ncbi:hypothetical protein EJ04DRAFT_510106 [Polyplosphaeria fusca]|uniref:BZIP domain-containing protein n=1 Tax=Polyplosphaeria fusca TaxID=682080 RepID=A0A9P4R612_9PLEO|nr:hypothetical protein EJ04DRAFT_510106 [Polyplosphaeria fusca]
MPSSPSSQSSTPSSSPTSSAHPVPRRARVSAEHTLNRVRENQRRHRARRKDYIAQLEDQLKATETLLEQARAEIASLRAEREAGWGKVVFGCEKDGHEEGKDGEKGEEEEEEEEQMMSVVVPATTPRQSEQDAWREGVLGRMEAIMGLEVLPLDSAQMTALLPSPVSVASSPSASAAPSLGLRPGPPPCCEDERVADEGEDEAVPVPPPADPECSTCKTRPAPSPTESTTLCSQAYVLISQQNFRGIDAATIRMWLFQGYRRAQRAGEGCRVENGALFRLLDYISGV